MMFLLHRDSKIDHGKDSKTEEKEAEGSPAQEEATGKCSRPINSLLLSMPLQCLYILNSVLMDSPSFAIENII